MEETVKPSGSVGLSESRDGGHAAYLHSPIELLLATCGYYRWPEVFILFN